MDDNYSEYYINKEDAPDGKVDDKRTEGGKSEKEIYNRLLRDMEQQRRLEEAIRRKNYKIIAAITSAAVLIAFAVTVALLLPRHDYPSNNDNYNTAYTATAKPTVKPAAEPTSKPTERPTEKPTEKPNEQPTEKPAAQSAHVQSPVYSEFNDVRFNLKIPYPDHFKTYLWSVNEGGQISIRNNNMVVSYLDNTTFSGGNLSEYLFVSANSDQSTYVWSTVVDEQSTGFNTAGDYMRWQKSHENGQSWDGSAGSDFYYALIYSPAAYQGKTHYRYCKHRNGKFFTIDIMYPTSMENIYADYVTQLYERFYANFK